MAVLWPDVKAGIVTALVAIDGFVLADDPAATAADALVYDGPIVSAENPARYVTVGWQDSTDDQSAGSYEQVPAPSGFSAQEDGTVLLELAAVVGESDVPDAFGLADAVTSWVHTNQTLGGVLSSNGTVSTAVEVLEAQNQAGATQRLLLTLSYTSWVV